jgi:two-component system invasion response regulator UvrY
MKASMPKVRVLVVDDHAIVRHTVCALLSEDPTLDIICLTATGEEAVTKAAELQPDLILMDISLPGINGIEAAHQISEVSPDSKTIFLSQHDSIQMAKDALRVCGYGYVTKTDAASDLLKAIQTVGEGGRFVSQRIVEQGWVAENV